MTDAPCTFCNIAAGTVEANIVMSADDIMVLTPRQTGAPGHLLVVPKVHVEDVTSDLDVSAAVFKVAAEISQQFENCHIITNRGALTSESVGKGTRAPHLVIHVVPVTKNNILPMPWDAWTN